MPDTREDLVEHLRRYAELGVDGISREAAWRARQSPKDRQKPAAPASGGTAPDMGDGSSVTAASSMGSTSTPAASAAPSAVVGVPRSAADALAALRTEIGDCTRCKLHAGRTNLVFGVGNPEAQLMFVGEGPGADEDEQGIPFVGRAGQLLTQIIKAMGYERDEVYIANVVKCRPPGNRNPEPDEIAQCRPFLLRQIETIRPRVIVALGKFAAQTLLETDEPISRLRGRFHPFGHTQVMPTFHPSYLLRTPSAKREVWEDMKQVMAVLKTVDE